MRSALWQAQEGAPEGHGRAQERYACPKAEGKRKAEGGEADETPKKRGRGRPEKVNEPEPEPESEPAVKQEATPESEEMGGAEEVEQEV